MQAPGNVVVISSNMKGGTVMATPVMQRMTRQRRAILDELRKLRTHPTADELYEIVRERLPRISLGTVYRNLDVLHRGGMVMKLDMGGGQSRFDGNTMEHHHVKCSGCGRVADLPENGIQLTAPLRASRNGFKITGYRVEFDGVCPFCQ